MIHDARMSRRSKNKDLVKLLSLAQLPKGVIAKTIIPSSSANTRPQLLSSGSIPLLITEIMDPWSEQQIKNNLAASDRAVAEGDFRTVLENQIENVTLVAEKENQVRYNKLHRVHLTISTRKVVIWPLSDRCISILTLKLMRNVEEPMFFRALSEHLLGLHFEDAKNKEAAITHFQSAITYCKAASESDRKREVGGQNIWGLWSVGEILDSVERHSIFQKDFLEDIVGFLAQQISKATNVLPQRELAQEFLEHMVQVGPNDGFPEPPTLTSDLFARLKAFPQNDKTYLLYLDKERPDGDGVDYTSFSPEIQERLKDPEMIRVFTVDVNRFHARKTKRVFQMVQCLICQKTSSHQKNLLSTLAHACEKPYNIIPGSKCHPPGRPKMVLLPTDKDSNDPLITNFLKMMGCPNSDAADPAMLEILERTKEDPSGPYDSRKILSKEDHPYLSDLEGRVRCGNCGLVGPKLKICECGKAYYCSAECQKANWKAHKKKHQKATTNQS